MRLTLDEVTLHEPVVVELAIENPSSEPIQIDLGVAEIEALDIEVQGRDGGTVERFAPQFGPTTWHTGGKIRLRPDEEYRSDVVLGQWFAFGAPGEYEVVIEFTGSITRETGAEVEVERLFILPLRVLPRNPHRLREVARELAEGACQSRDLGAAYDAAQVLSTIDDPVVVPFLEELLGCNYTAQGMAAAALGRLGRLGTTEAITPLLTAAKSDDPDLADVAQHVLSSLLRQEATPIAHEWRERIERVVETSDSERSREQGEQDDELD